VYGVVLEQVTVMVLLELTAAANTPWLPKARFVALIVQLAVIVTDTVKVVVWVVACAARSPSTKIDAASATNRSTEASLLPPNTAHPRSRHPMSTAAESRGWFLSRG
jgi:hypothetical protein